MIAERGLMVLVAAVLAWAWVAFRIGRGDETADFQVFYLAASHWHAPYDAASLDGLPEFARGRLPFAYPPTFLLFAYPFTHLPYEVAYLTWAAGSYALFILAASYLNLRAAWLLVVVPFATILVIGFGGPRVYEPIIEGVTMGQTSHWTGAGLILAGLLLDKRPAVAGALLALVACLKPTAALVAPVVLWGRWRGLVAAILVGCGLVLATLPLGPHLWLEWIEATKPFGGGAMQLQPAGVIDHPAWSALLVIAGLWFAFRQRNLTGLLVGSILCTPYLMPYDLAAITALGAGWIAAWRTKRILAGVGVVLLVGGVGSSLAVLVATVVIMLVLSFPAQRPLRLSDERDALAGLDGKS